MDPAVVDSTLVFEFGELVDVSVVPVDEAF